MRFSFTGSTASDKAVIRDAAAGIKPLTLELGGNDPAIVLPDVDIKTVAQYVQWINVPHFVPYLPTHRELQTCVHWSDKQCRAAVLRYETTLYS